MSIKYCPSCHKEVRDTFSKCPYCSISFSNISTNSSHDTNDSVIINSVKGSVIINKIKKYIIMTLSILGILFVLFIVMAINSTPSSTPNTINSNSETLDQEQYNEPAQIAIPMSDEHENNRYFLLTRNSVDNIEKITYLRKGDYSDVYGVMEINCKKNKFRSNTTEKMSNLGELSLGDWTTPSPDWTDKDIVNFICLN